MSFHESDLLAGRNDVDAVVSQVGFRLLSGKLREQLTGTATDRKRKFCFFQYVAANQPGRGSEVCAVESLGARQVNVKFIDARLLHGRRKTVEDLPHGLASLDALLPRHADYCGVRAKFQGQSGGHG